MNNFILPKNCTAGDYLTSFCSAQTIKVLPRENLSQAVKESISELNPSGI